MKSSTMARIGATAFVTVAITATALQMRSSGNAAVTEMPAEGAGPVADPLRAALYRCQALGTAAAGDHDCLQAWAENRRRFLAPGARPEAPMTPAPNVAAATLAGNAVDSAEGR